MILRPAHRIEFDPSLVEHRDAVRDYMKRFAWSDTKFRFNDNPNFGSIHHMVQEKMLIWYMAQEQNKASRSRSKAGPSA